MWILFDDERNLSPRLKSRSDLCHDTKANRADVQKHNTEKWKPPSVVQDEQNDTVKAPVAEIMKPQNCTAVHGSRRPWLNTFWVSRMESESWRHQQLEHTPVWIDGSKPDKMIVIMINWRKYNKGKSSIVSEEREENLRQILQITIKASQVSFIISVVANWISPTG